MNCHYDYGTNNRAPRWTFTGPCKPEVNTGAREESASPTWLAAPAMNARVTTKKYIWRLDTGFGPTLYRKGHSHITLGKTIRTLESSPSRVILSTTSSTRQREQLWQKCKIRRLCHEWYRKVNVFWDHWKYNRTDAMQLTLTLYYHGLH